MVEKFAIIGRSLRADGSVIRENYVGNETDLINGTIKLLQEESLSAAISFFSKRMAYQYRTELINWVNTKHPGKNAEFDVVSIHLSTDDINI